MPQGTIKPLSRSTEVCFHCGLPLPGSGPVQAEAGGEIKNFCCNGCAAVCQAIFESGLEGYYERANTGQPPFGPPPLPPEHPEIYDMEDVQAGVVAGDGVKEAYFLVDGIHCAACVWLIERALTGKTRGVVSAEVNLASKKLKVKWDENATHLSTIIQRLGKLGYAATPYSTIAADEATKKNLRLMLYRIGLAGFAAMNMMWIAIALWAGASEGEFRDFFRWAGLFLATPTLLYSGWPFFAGAFRGLRGLTLTMDLPIAIGASATYLYSVYVTALNPAQGETYFDTVVTFIFVILVGRYLEAASRHKAADATLRLMELQPKVVTVIRENGEEIIPVKAALEGDMALIRPGERIAVDGIVMDGESEADESVMTGESRPISKKQGDEVVAGTMNQSGALRVRVTRPMRETALAKMINLIEEAQASRAPVQRISDKIVPWFVAATLGVAVFTWMFWIGDGVEKALMASTAVLIITCPCALGMATPMAIVVAAGWGAKNGIFIKNGESLETLAKANSFLFDKTGALTEGKIKVTGFNPAEGVSPGELLSLASAVERYSEHGLARAVVLKARELGLEEPERVEDFKYTPGMGVAAKVDGAIILAGSARWLEGNGAPVSPAMLAMAQQEEAGGATCVFAARNGTLMGYITLTDNPRENAGKTVDRLKADGMELAMLTGDRLAVAKHLAVRLGGMELIAEMKPEQKAAAVKERKSAGKVVVMVGDGVNDAPALATADVGIAVATGSDVSMASAGVIVTGASLFKVYESLALARRTLAVIKQNLTISLVYNLVMVPLAAGGFVTPVLAAVAMPISSLLVIGNSARIGMGVVGWK
ncbi:MAG: heavy metal translocating P-type ATPase [Nitrospinae bacterium]|nr:heavy metal translocating P-type ATPase [Nitrospinota bacterium]